MLSEKGTPSYDNRVTKMRKEAKFSRIFLPLWHILVTFAAEIARKRPSKLSPTRGESAAILHKFNQTITEMDDYHADNNNNL